MPQRKKIKPQSTMKLKPTADLRLKAYGIVSDAVDTGILVGMNRAHKHMDTPNSTDIYVAVLTAVMNELCDIIDFGD